MVTEALESIARSSGHEETYEEAMEALLADMKKGWKLNLGDKIPWTRDELHER